jgi:hypothetical protein
MWLWRCMATTTRGRPCSRLATFRVLAFWWQGKPITRDGSSAWVESCPWHRFEARGKVISMAATRKEVVRRLAFVKRCKEWGA